MNRSGERFILTVVGKDHPGIIADIAGILYEYECDIQELNGSLEKCCKALEVTYALRPATLASNPLPGEDECVGTPSSTNKVIITVFGADRIGIVAEVTKALADMGINIIELTTAPSYIVYDGPQYTMIARVEVDDSVDMPALRSTLEDRAQSLSVEINVQSQEIFNAMHKI